MAAVQMFMFGENQSHRRTYIKIESPGFPENTRSIFFRKFGLMSATTVETASTLLPADTGAVPAQRCKLFRKGEKAGHQGYGSANAQELQRRDRQPWNLLFQESAHTRRANKNDNNEERRFGH